MGMMMLDRDRRFLPPADEPTRAPVRVGVVREQTGSNRVQAGQVRERLGECVSTLRTSHRTNVGAQNHAVTTTEGERDLLVSAETDDAVGTVEEADVGRS